MASGLVDEVKKMKEDVEALRNAARGETTSEEDGERLEMVLEDLIERVENVDNAGDLHTNVFILSNVNICIPLTEFKLTSAQSFQKEGNRYEPA